MKNTFYLENMNSDTVLSVTEYIDLTNRLIREPLSIGVKGEVTSVADRGNVVFFTISDQEKSKLSCLVWKTIYRGLAFELEEGMEINIYGYPNIYKGAGKFTYIANSITAVGEGALKKAFEELKAKLESKGLFAIDKKQELKPYVKNIGLITADGSDAKKDFETHLGKYGFKIHFSDVRVEGARSVNTIVNAIRWFNENTHNIDVLVLTRGGGSLESLQSFNSEAVAKAIHSSKIPVLSAVGHENDVTIADLVADLRASTPTDAGKLISEPYKYLQTKLATLSESLLFSFEKRFIAKVKTIEADFIRNTKDISSKIAQVTKSINNSSNILLTSFSNQLMHTKNMLEFNSKMLRSFDPKLKLKQGYSITRDSNGNLIKSSKQVTKDDTIITELIGNKLKSRVIDS